MEQQTLETVAVSIPPTASPPTSTKPSTTTAVCPFSGQVAQSSGAGAAKPSTATAVCPFSGQVAQPAGEAGSSEVQTHTCPFATLLPPAASQRVVAEVVDGTVVESVVPRRCPRWVRVLRFTAKYIAKQVVIRSLKAAVMAFVKHSRGSHAETPSISASPDSAEVASS